MGDQRRRSGRGRSGRGGRIPRKGEAAATQAHDEEAFVSFPLSITGPIRVTSLANEAGIQAVLSSTLERETRQVAAVQAAVQQSPDPVLGGVATEIERHRDQLRQLARDIGVDLPAPGEAAAAEAGDPWDLVAVQRLARLGWATLQQAAYAFGDKRVDRVVKSVLKEKDRHVEVLEAWAVRAVSGSLFREPEY